LRRKQVESLLAQLETTIPDVRQVMLHALKNVRPTHLLDQSVAAAWSERRPELRPSLRPQVIDGHLPILE
jgi:tRNA(Ile)-lysidine synthase TilS/MesJ